MLISLERVVQRLGLPDHQPNPQTVAGIMFQVGLEEQLIMLGNREHEFIYSYWSIKQAIIRAVMDQPKTIRIPIHTTEKLNKMKKAARILSQKLGRMPNVQEIAAESGISQEQVLDLLESNQKKAISLDTLIGEGQDTTLGELLEDDNAAATMEDYVLYSSMREHMEQLMSEYLKPQEQQVLSLRFGLTGEDGGLSLGKIGQQMNLTRELIRQVESNGLKKLRRHSEVLGSIKFFYTGSLTFATFLAKIK